MTFHREGTNIMLITTLATVVINVLSFAALGGSHMLPWSILVLSLAYLVLTFRFFRVPDRTPVKTDVNTLLSPADGKIVVIEKIKNHAYFKDERIQVSVFMSPLNVHINWYPINSTVLKSTYFPGKFLVAWHPKSSELNEQHAVVLKAGRHEILVKQIAGAAARRIVNYSTPDQSVKQAEELGFIKFGSRVDVILPADSKVLVELGQKVTGIQTLLARLSD